VARNLRSSEPAAAAPLPAEAQTEKDWTVLVYMEGRHRLAHSTDVALNKLEQLGSTANVHVAVQATQVPEWQELILPNMQQLPTRRYYMQPDAEPAKVTSPVLEEMPAALPLNKDSLADFLTWGIEKFPGKQLMVVIKKHGAGFASIAHKGESFAPLSARETEAALAEVEKRTGRKPDVLAFDSCSMQQMEVAYQLRNRTKVMTGSEEDVLALAYPYADVIKNLDISKDQVNAKGAGRVLVATYADKVKNGMHSAADLSRMEGVAGQVRSFVDCVEANKVDQRLLYTSMLETRPMEKRETLALQHNFRDLGSFFKAVSEDHRYPVDVREHARTAGKTLDDAILARFASEDRKLLKTPTGLTGFLPWREMTPQMRESYNQLDWAKDSGWGRFLDYVFSERVSDRGDAEQTATRPPLGLAQRFGRWGLYQYKKYISPYLNVTCAYTPSCSQFAREAIEKHGFWEGSKIGALRFFSCTGSAHGHDPVKGTEHVCAADCKEHHQNPDLAKTLVEPMRNVVSPETFQKHRRWIGLAQKVGLMAGGVGLAALTMPFGAAVGAWTGFQAGTGQIQNRVDTMAAKYNSSVVRGFLNVAEPVGMPGFTVHNRVLDNTGSPLLAKIVGGAAGTAAGLALGVGGAAWQGFLWGRTFGGLWAGNRVKEALGHLPAHPETLAILKQDYQTA
jgi:uncharacterized protein